jgi:hypothetical protein
MRSFPALLVLSFLALPLFAVEVDPAAPTTATPVTLTVHELASCPPPPEVSRSGNTFNVLLKPGPCLSPATDVRFTIPLGKLAPGDYEVVVVEPSFSDVRRVDYGAFFVSDADAKVIVQSQPFGPTTGGTEVVLSADAFGCLGSACPLPKVLFNGVPAAVVKEKFVQGTLAVITPPGPKGLADVVVVGTNATTSGRVFRYYDPSDAPLPTMFERVLVPVWFSGAGAFGSKWTTEVTLLNPSLYGFEPYRRSPLTFVAKRSTTALDFGGPRAGGVLFFPPRGVSPATRFGALVRDTSRQGEDWGTEVRVVREGDFRTTEFSLLNIPLDARFRQTLRIYDVDSVESQLSISAFAADGTFLAEKVVQLHSATPCRRFEPCASDDPASATFDLAALVPEAAGQQRVRLDIRAVNAVRMWGFVTVTNNETQHVTVITPQ